MYAQIVEQVEKNKTIGKQWEEIFIKQAQSNGLLVLRNYLTCRFLYKGRVQVVKGELDFKLINRDGRVGFFDAKSFAGDSFVYSNLEENQINRAALYNEFLVPAGFVVFFRKLNRIVYYSGSIIARKGARSNFQASEGISLGTYVKFDLKRLLA